MIRFVIWFERKFPIRRSLGNSYFRFKRPIIDLHLPLSLSGSKIYGWIYDQSKIPDILQNAGARLKQRGFHESFTYFRICSWVFFGRLQESVDVIMAQNHSFMGVLVFCRANLIKKTNRVFDYTKASWLAEANLIEVHNRFSNKIVVAKL